MSLKGDILSGDHTFAIANVPHPDHQRIFEGLYSNLNEYNQVVGYYMTMSQSVGELKTELAELKTRYGPTIEDGPALFYTDSCCKERRVLK